MATMLANSSLVDSRPGIASREAAARTWTPADGLPALEELAADPAATVRYLVAANANTPQPQLDRLANDHDAMVSWAASRRAPVPPDRSNLPFDVPVGIFRNWFFIDPTELLYQLSLLGVLEIRDDGTVWQVGKLKLNRRRRECRIAAVEPRRAERRTRKGYMEVCLLVAQAFVATSTHRLIQRAFNGPIPSRHSVHHIDENQLNNRPENLRIIHNALHTKVHKAHKGHVKDLSREQMLDILKMSPRDVQRIRRLWRDGMLQRDIARMYGVTQAAISKIVRRRTWAWVGEEENKQG